jgi:hypothetical protein
MIICCGCGGRFPPPSNPAAIEEDDCAWHKPIRFLRVVLVNEDKNSRFSEWDEPLADTWLGEDATSGEIFRAMRREYGRCTSKIYFSYAGRPDREAGWYFIKRCEYEDSSDTYLRGAWVTVEKLAPYTNQPEGAHQ